MWAKNGINGIIKKYLDELQALLDWECSSVIPYVEGQGTSFNRFIDMMGNCSDSGRVKDDPKCTCDIGIGGWFSSAYREFRVDVLPPFVFDGIRVTFHVANTHRSGEKLFFLTTFDIPSWICIFSVIGLFALAKFLDHRFVPINASQQQKASTHWTRCKVMFTTSLRRFGRSLKSTGMCTTVNHG